MSAELLDQLATISRNIEEHRTAIWLLENQRLEVQMLLAKSGWKSPEVEA